MKKILLALNAANPDMEALDLACYLGKLTRSKVTGVFMEKEPLQPSVTPAEPFLLQERSSGAAVNPVLDQAIFHFKEACICRETNYLLTRENAITAEELIEESRFSDVLILPAGLSPGTGPQTAPSPICRHVLSGAHCPVVLSPGSFERVDEIVFTHNGSKASVFAMRQFTYLFPELANTPVTVLAVNSDKETLADKPALMEWLTAHYRQVAYNFTSGDPVDQLINYLLPRRYAFVVMGAYGRNAMLRMLKRSTADPVAETLFNPLFIAHN